MKIMLYAPPIVACAFAGLGMLLLGFGNSDERRAAGYALTAASLALFLIVFLGRGAR